MKRYNTITKILDAVAEADTRKEKIDILTFNHSIQLKRVFRLAYHPDYNYIRIPEYQKIRNGMGMQFMKALDFLETKIAKGNLKGIGAKKELIKILVSVTAEEAEVIERIMKHDLKCGIGKGIAKKIYGKNLYK